MTVKVVVDVYVRPELVEEYLDHLRQAMATTPAFEGCLEAELFRDLDVPNRLAVIETWLSRDDQARYFKWRATQGGMQDVFERPLMFSFYDAVDM